MRPPILVFLAAALLAHRVDADRLAGSLAFTNVSALPVHVVMAQPMPVLFDAPAVVGGKVGLAASSPGPLRVESANQPIFRIVNGRRSAMAAFPSLVLNHRRDEPVVVRRPLALLPDGPALDGELHAVVEALVWPGCTLEVSWDLDMRPAPGG